MGADHLVMERGLGFLELTMTDVQVKAAVKSQKAAKKLAKLTYRGVAYLKKNWEPRQRLCIWSTRGLDSCQSSVALHPFLLHLINLKERFKELDLVQV